uniref:FUZ/MON1/HPS1 third Longin domain-containing protein n=1 Tax=Ditylenchus dipsaci TaxID=166011 RepID=A0A915E658_9BILA
MSPQKPYISYQELSSLHHGYFKVTNLLRRVKERNEQKIKMFFFTTERCSLFTWIAPNIELHCTFSPLVTQAFAMETAEKILKIMVSRLKIY